MSNEDQVRFKKGLLYQKTSVSTPGSLFFATDAGRLFLQTGQNSRIEMHSDIPFGVMSITADGDGSVTLDKPIVLDDGVSIRVMGGLIPKTLNVNGLGARPVFYPGLGDALPFPINEWGIFVFSYSLELGAWAYTGFLHYEASEATITGDYSGHSDPEKLTLVSSQSPEIVCDGVSLNRYEYTELYKYSTDSPSNELSDAEFGSWISRLETFVSYPEIYVIEIDDNLFALKSYTLSQGNPISAYSSKLVYYNAQFDSTASSPIQVSKVDSSKPILICFLSESLYNNEGGFVVFTDETLTGIYTYIVRSRFLSRGDNISELKNDMDYIRESDLPAIKKHTIVLDMEDIISYEGRCLAAKVDSIDSIPINNTSAIQDVLLTLLSDIQNTDPTYLEISLLLGQDITCPPARITQTGNETIITTTVSLPNESNVVLPIIDDRGDSGNIYINESPVANRAYLADTPSDMFMSDSTCEVAISISNGSKSVSVQGDTNQIVSYFVDPSEYSDHRILSHRVFLSINGSVGQLNTADSTHIWYSVNVSGIDYTVVLEHVTVPEGDVIPEGSINVMIYGHDTDRGVYEVIVGWVYKEEIEHTFGADLTNPSSMPITTIDGTSVSGTNLIAQVAQEIHEAYLFCERFGQNTHNICLHALFNGSKIELYPWIHTISEASTHEPQYMFKCLPSYIPGLTPTGCDSADIVLYVYSQNGTWGMFAALSQSYLGSTALVTITNSIGGKMDSKVIDTSTLGSDPTHLASSYVITEAINSAVNSAIGNAIGGSY